MKKQGRGTYRGSGQGARGHIPPTPPPPPPQLVPPLDDPAQPAQDAAAAAPPQGPVLLSITPQGVTLPGGLPATTTNPSSEAARLRRQLEEHARDVEEFVRNQRFNSIVTKVLADLDRHHPTPAAVTGPVLRLRR